MKKGEKGKIRIAKIRCHKWLLHMVHVVYLVKREINLSLSYIAPNSRRVTKKNWYNI